VLRRVLVVELEHVGEQHHGAAVGAVQLEGCGVALTAVAREDLEEPDERSDCQQRQRRRRGSHGYEEGERREDRVDSRAAEEVGHNLA